STLLGDFGIALMLHSSSPLSTQAVTGTWAYMAPEQIQGHPCFASDQYALAIMAYEWICGTRPFEGMGYELPVQHLHVQPPSLRAKVPHLPEAVERVVMRGLEKAPQDRFENVQAFAQAFREAVVESQRPTSPVRAVQREVSPPPVTSLVKSIQREVSLPPVTPPAKSIQRELSSLPVTPPHIQPFTPTP